MTLDFPNLRHLRAFVAVADRGGISAAASAVHLSQPAVTQAVAGLEARFGAALFERRTKGMVVTPAGEILLFRTRRMLANFADGAALAIRRANRREDRPVPGFDSKVTAAQLRALTAIRDSGSFTLAARTLGISQPSIHRAGRDLEKLSGITLFAAARKGIEMTPAADALARAVKLAAAEFRQALDELAHLRGADSSQIKVGTLPLSRSEILPAACDALIRETEGVQIISVDAPYADLLRGLRFGDFDMIIGALRDDLPVDDVDQAPLFEDQLAIVAGPRHPLTGQTGLTLDDARAYPWIAPPRNTPTGAFLLRTMELDKSAPSPVRLVSSSMVMVRGLLTRGDYLTILSPRQAAVEIAQGLIVPLDIPLPGSTRTIGLTTRRGWIPTPTQARFLAHIRAAVAADP